MEWMNCKLVVDAIRLRKADWEPPSFGICRVNSQIFLFRVLFELFDVLEKMSPKKQKKCASVCD